MKKRTISFLLAVVMLLSLLPAGVQYARAESAMTASDECIKMIKLEEGMSKTPYWDFTQYTVGYGTTCPPDMVEYYTQNGITEAEAETLLRNHLTALERDINRKIVDKYSLTLTQNQFDAIVLFSYNCGTAWAYETNGTFHQAIATGATGNDLIRAFALWCSAGDQVRTFLLRRRLCEANLYLNNVYSMTPPDNYCYVLYDANGGTVSPRSQGYDSNLTAKPFPVPTLSGYTFLGWYTAKTGGTKVELLDAAAKSLTLYARWEDAKGNAPAVTGPTAENPYTITVTGTGVNLREGPGTNYKRVGEANKGQQLVITETATGSGYTWGKFDGGWIALEYTDYETVKNNQTPPPTDPPATTEPPAATEPPVTAEPPATTEPAVTTEPPVSTEPPVTAEPPATQPETPKLMGTVNVQEWLRVRSGPGTSYSVAGYLKPNERVEILDQKTVGSMKWGQIAQGWISLDYVILDKTESTGGSTGSTQTGKVTATELLIRNGPGTTYSIVGYLTNGVSVTVTERRTNGASEWGKISQGWICLDYVRFDTASTEPTTPTTPAPTEPAKTLMGTVNVQEWLRVRSGPGTSYSVAGYLKPRERVEILDQKTVGSTKWGKITQGWISLDYVILDKAESTGGSTGTQTVTKTVTADCLRVRRGPGTENAIVGYLYYGTKVEIYETALAANGGQWGRTASGWIYMGYTK